MTCVGVLAKLLVFNVALSFVLYRLLFFSSCCFRWLLVSTWRRRHGFKSDHKDTTYLIPEADLRMDDANVKAGENEMREIIQVCTRVFIHAPSP